MRIFVYGSLLIPTEAQKYGTLIDPPYTLEGARRVFARLPRPTSRTTVLDLQWVPGARVPGRLMRCDDPEKLKALRRRERGYRLVRVPSDPTVFVFWTPVGPRRDGRRRLCRPYLARILAALGAAQRTEFLRTTWHRGRTIDATDSGH